MNRKQIEQLQKDFDLACINSECPLEDIIKTQEMINILLLTTD